VTLSPRHPSKFEPLKASSDHLKEPLAPELKERESRSFTDGASQNPEVPRQLPAGQPPTYIAKKGARKRTGR